MPSFDIVSKTDLSEVDNAVANALREVGTRFDFKGSRSSIERDGNTLTVTTEDDTRLRQLHELLKGHLTRRKVDAGVLEFKEPERASGNTVRQRVVIREGIDQELGKRIVKELKGSKLKVQVAIQGDELRVTGKKRDDLQAAIQHVKGMDIDQPLQYVNMRD